MNTVLVVEDNPQLCADVVGCLEEHHAVIEADNGLSGILKAGGSPART